MTVREITIEQLYRSVFAIRIKISFIVAAIMGLISLITIVLVACGVLHWIERPTCLPVMVTSLMFVLTSVLSAVSLICSGSKERKVFEAEIAALGGPDALMSEVYNETLYVLSRFGKPHTIITRRHIIEVGYHIYPMAGIARVHKREARASYQLKLYYYGNNPVGWGFARVWFLRHKEFVDIYNTIRSMNPCMEDVIGN